MKMLLILGILFPLTSFAIGTRGGGNSVVCRESSREITSAQLLDFYEAKTLRGTRISSFPSEIGYEQIVENTLKNISNKSLEISRLLREEFEMMKKDSLFLDNNEIVPVNDSNHLIFKKDCLVEQTAVQKDKKFSQDKKYFFNNEIWNALPEIDRAGLIFHELIYSMLRKDAPYITTSEGVRYVNSKIFSDEFKNFSKLDFALLFSEAGFRTLFLDQVRFNKNESTWLTRITGNGVVLIGNVSTYGNIQIKNESNTILSLFGPSAFSIGYQKYISDYIKFNSGVPEYAIVVTDETSTFIKKCWVHFDNKGNMEKVSFGDNNGDTRMYNLGLNPLLTLNRDCQTEQKNEDYELIKKSLFDSIL